MGLTKRPNRYGKKATANRQNAQHSTGPQTEAGKQNSSLNGLVHGLYSNARTYAAMLALGESPSSSGATAPVSTAPWGCGLDPLFDMEVDELAWLLWRKQRVEHTHGSVLVARKEQADTESQHSEREYSSHDTPDEEGVGRVGLRRLKDSPAAFDQTLVTLNLLKGYAEQRNFTEDHLGCFLMLYGKNPACGA
jgi:hypothetical protein